MGVHVVLSARSGDKLQALADDLSGRTTVLPLDVTDSAALEAAADTMGEIDGVVHLAAVYWPFSATAWDAERANQMADVNFSGAMKLVSAVVPRFAAADRGHIVLTGSLSGFRGLPGAAPYAASKAGVMALAESLYADLRNTGVEVQLVNPGFIRTRLTEKNDFAMPFIMDPEQAAEIMFDHMNDGGFKRSFPRGFSYVFRGSQFLPDWMYYRLFA